MESLPVHTVVFEGHLTAAQVRDKLSPVAAKAEKMKFGLVVNVLDMTSYEHDARGAFVEWNREQKDRVHRVGVVTNKAMWRMVISTMAIATGQDLAAFEDEQTAHAWAGSTG